MDNLNFQKQEINKISEIEKIQNIVSTGSNELNIFLGGGYEKGVVTTIFGPSGSGKTNLCLLAAANIAKTNQKVLIIDTEGGIAAQRIKQLTGENYKEVLENILFLQPLTFEDQILAFEKIKTIIKTENIIAVIVDSIAMLYRLELGKPQAIFETNSALARQIGTLVEVARKQNIPVIMTNQVYSDFNNRNEVKMVGGDLLKYSSKCLIELKKQTNQKEESAHKLILHKHRFLSPNSSFIFTIKKKGIEEEKWKNSS